MDNVNIKAGVHTSDLFEVVLPILKKGHHAAFTVSGMSMWPFLCHNRDQVIVAACDPSRLAIGDIVLLQTPLGNYLLHRITGLRSGEFETTGDGNCFRDGWFPRSCAKAKVKTIIRNGKELDCRNPFWRLVFSLWRHLFPVRRYLLRLLKWIGNRKRGIRK
jgi:hypothetical protein